MKLKKGVRISGVRPEIVLALSVVDEVYKTYNKDFVVTSLTDGKHSERSSHYRGEAFDCRTRYFKDEQIDVVQADIKDALGGDFIVLFEQNHFHIQFSPRKLE